MVGLTATPYIILAVTPLILAVSAVLAYIIRYSLFTKCLLLAVYTLALASATYSLKYAASMGSALVFFRGEFRIDVMSSLFAILVSIIGLSVLLYSIPYMEWYAERCGICKSRLGSYYSLLTIAVLALYMLSYTNNTFILWSLVEATTLSTVLLVTYGSYARSLEAGWKYILLCVVGLAMSLYGTALIYSMIFNATGKPYEGLFFNKLVSYAGLVSPKMLFFAMLFIICGFGVKAGIFPFHFWLPDAYTEAPTPISALLSSFITGCGYFAILRWVTSLPVQFYISIRHLVIILSLASLFLGAASMIKQLDLKRILAYSSIENMGAMLLAIAYPKLGCPFGLLYLLSHGVLKAAAFMSVGCVEYRYGRRSGLSGIISDDRIIGGLILSSGLAVEGLPPTLMFFSIVGVAASISSRVILLLYLIGIFIGFVALMHRFIKTAWGEASGLVHSSNNTPKLMLIVPAALVALMVMLGVMVAPLTSLCGVHIP